MDGVNSRTYRYVELLTNAWMHQICQLNSRCITWANNVPHLLLKSFVAQPITIGHVWVVKLLQINNLTTLIQ